MKHKSLNSQSILFVTMFLILISCASTPDEAGVSESEMNAEAAKAYIEIKSKSKMSGNRELQKRVQVAAGRIAKASGKDYQWEAVLLESPEANAWCMPGGKIAVYTGILPVLKTEAALAAVLGHEVAHATLRHGMQGYARAKKENYLGLIVGGAAIVGGQLLCKDERCRKLTQLGGIAAGFAIAFLDRKFSREDESAADHEGQLLMAKAGYDPSEAIRVWERMGQNMAGRAPPEWMSTHPSAARRIENLTQWLPAAQSEYQQTPIKYGLGEPIRQ